MMDGWVVWLLLVGFAVGVVVAGLLLLRMPRQEGDVEAVERREEATWIAATIERRGGIAPASFVEEVLELHQAYLLEGRPTGQGPSWAAPPAPTLPPARRPVPGEGPPSARPPGPHDGAGPGSVTGPSAGSSPPPQHGPAAPRRPPG